MADTQQQYPSLNPYNNSNGNGTINSAKNTAAQTMDSIKNNETVQSLANGPVADKARNEATNTRNEFSNLAASKTTPSTQTATGQNLTHYHSFFFNMLSWENPRATAITYASIVLFIFATRYVPLVRYALKGTYMILGITAAAELVGRLALGQGFATKIRPQRYYTVPRETLESVMEDLVELANFFVIESQRVVFAENVSVTVGAFTTAFITYFLVKIMPSWGISLLFTTFAFFTPLIYVKNQAVIDEQIANASDILNKQATQVRDLASQHTSKAMEASQSALKDASAKASEMMGNAKKSAVDQGIVSPETAQKVPEVKVKSEDFPAAPSQEPTQPQGGHMEPQGGHMEPQGGHMEPLAS